MIPVRNILTVNLLNQIDFYPFEWQKIARILRTPVRNKLEEIKYKIYDKTIKEAQAKWYR